MSTTTHQTFTLTLGNGTLSFEYVPAVTTAPKAYDGFGTFTLEEAGDIRIVLIQAEHLDWQQGRYLSGLHQCNLDTGFDTREIAESLMAKLLA